MVKPVTPGEWIVRRPRPGKARPRLFCFPFAGGGPAAFRAWGDAVPSLEICAIQAPGREMRMREAPLDSVGAIVDALAPVIRPLLDQPFAFFGYSLGSFIAFELARRIRRDGAPMPAHLFLGACPSPQLHRVRAPIHGLPDAELTDALKAYQGTSPEVLEHAELMTLLLPILRADFGCFETFTHVPEAPLDVPITALGGLQDPQVSREQMDGWREHTSRAFVLRMFPGNHFFMNTEKTRLLGAILQDMAALLRP